MQQAIAKLLHADRALDLRAIVRSAEEALKLVVLASTDVLLTDVSLPSMNGLQLVRAVRAVHPHLRCLMFSSHTEASYVSASLLAGASGYVAKSSLQELTAAIRAVRAGGVYLSTSLRGLRDP